jgi:hypothetical protein
LGFFGDCRGGIDLGFVGENGRSTACSFFGVGCTAAPVPLGCAGATVAGLVECNGGSVRGGFPPPQAAQASVKTPVTAQPAHRGKARTWNPLLIQVLANLHSTHVLPKVQHREWPVRAAGSPIINLGQDKQAIFRNRLFPDSPPYGRLLVTLGEQHEPRFDLSREISRRGTSKCKLSGTGRC